MRFTRLSIALAVAFITTAAAAAGQPAGRRAPRPVGLGGFRFGDSHAAVLHADGCEEGGQPGSVLCALPSETLGFPAHLIVRFCRGRACDFMAWRDRDSSMSDDQWMQAYVDLSTRLGAKYGDADVVTTENPPACDRDLHTLLACIEAGSAQRSMMWNWFKPDALVFLSLVAGRPGTMIAVEYSSERWIQQKNDNL